MQLTIELPDEIARELLAKNGTDLTGIVLEMVALEGYRSGELTHAQVGRLLGLECRFDVDAFLKAHDASLHYTVGDLEQDRAAHRRLGLR